MAGQRPPAVARLIKQVQDNDNDFICAVSGFRGVGKSTLVLQVAKHLIGDEYWTQQGFLNHNIYSQQVLNKKLEEFPEKNTIVVDEAINLLFKREFQQKQQNQIIKKFNTYRNKKFAVFLIIPHFPDLDRAVRNTSMIKWWIHCIDRGVAFVYQQEDNEFNWDTWNVKENFLRLRAGTKRWQLRNYLMTVNWSPIPEDVFKVYEKVKDKLRAESYDKKKKEEKKLTKRDVIEAIAHINPKFNRRLLANVIKTDYTYISRTVPEQFRQQ